MQNSFSTVWEFADLDVDLFTTTKPNLDFLRWSFALLPDARMKTVAAGWMVRVLLGGDPAMMNEEEIAILTASALLATKERTAASGRLLCDA